MAVKITISGDDDLENPADFAGQWTPYSFSTWHSNFKHPDDLDLIPPTLDPDPETETGAELKSKLESGLGFWLAYYEHSGCLWMLDSGPFPAGVEFRWDGRRRAGLLLWESDEDDLGLKTYDGREADARAFLDRYNSWCNGEGLMYEIEGSGVSHWDSACGGFYLEKDLVDDLAQCLWSHGIFDFEVEDEGRNLKPDIERALARIKVKIIGDPV